MLLLFRDRFEVALQIMFEDFRTWMHAENLDVLEKYNTHVWKIRQMLYGAEAPFQKSKM